MGIAAGTAKTKAQRINPGASFFVSYSSTLVMHQISLLGEFLNCEELRNLHRLRAGTLQPVTHNQRGAFPRKIPSAKKSQ
jgi:hypothetical protein